MRRRDVPSCLLDSDFFALSLGLDMVDVGGFVVAAAIVVVWMTSPGELREMFVLRSDQRPATFSHKDFGALDFRRRSRRRKRLRTVSAPL